MDKNLLGTLLEKAKTVLRITTSAFDDEIEDIIEAGFYDLATRGVIINQNDLSPLVLRAIMTYVKMHFGESENSERLQRSYAEQRGQLMTTTGYTDWEGE